MEHCSHWRCKDLQKTGNSEGDIPDKPTALFNKEFIARNRGHFAPVVNCQRNLIFKMADKDYRSQGKRIPYDILNNLSSVDLFYEEKGKKKTSSKKILGVYQAEWLIARIHTAEKPAA